VRVRVRARARVRVRVGRVILCHLNPNPLSDAQRSSTMAVFRSLLNLLVIGKG